MSYTRNEGSAHAFGDGGSPMLGVGQDGVYKSLPIQTLEPDLFAAGEINVPSAATAAVVTLAAPGQDRANVVGGVLWSYSAAPTGGRLTIADGSDTVLDIDITAAGPGAVTFNPPRKARANKALVVTLASGAGAVVGKVNIIAAWVEPSSVYGIFDGVDADQTFAVDAMWW